MLENPEKKPERRPETRRNALTIGIGSQETADRFLRVKTGTYEETIVHLLDAYERPSTDNSETIANLQQRINDLENETNTLNEAIADRNRTIEEYTGTISELEERLEAARNEANKNAEILNSRQLMLDELKRSGAGVIVLNPNPVVSHFLNEMAEKTKSTPAKILEQLFLLDLQNPLANNLPYTVSSREIRRVMEELKEQKEE